MANSTSKSPSKSTFSVGEGRKSARINKLYFEYNAISDSILKSGKTRKLVSRNEASVVLKFPDSIEDYVEGKTDFILKILEKNGLNSDRLEEIRKMNLAPK